MPRNVCECRNRQFRLDGFFTDSKHCKLRKVVNHSRNPLSICHSTDFHPFFLLFIIIEYGCSLIRTYFSWIKFHLDGDRFTE
ncbi:hypothetical protein D3C73_1124390 [compost metagenome]